MRPAATARSGVVGGRPRTRRGLRIAAGLAALALAAPWAGPASAQERPFPTSDLQTPREVSFQSWDGSYIQGFLYTPPQVEAGMRCPALVQVHGGGTNSYTLGQNLTEQHLAAQGFVVLAINYRGGSGFGRRFQDLGVEDWLNGQAKDPGAAADWLRSLDATTGTVGVYGGSYGGSQALAAATRTPEKFDAVVATRGAYSKLTTFGLIDRLGKIFTKTGHGGLPDERPEIYEKSHTIGRLERLAAPVLLMHGEEDRRVPYRSQQLAVERLEALGKEYEAVSYPGEGHGFSDPENRIDLARRRIAWFRTHLGDCR